MCCSFDFAPFASSALCCTLNRSFAAQPEVAAAAELQLFFSEVCFLSCFLC